MVDDAEVVSSPDEGTAGPSESLGLNDSISAALEVEEQQELPFEDQPQEASEERVEEAKPQRPRRGRQARAESAGESATDETAHAAGDGAAAPGSTAADLQAPDHWDAQRKQAFAGLPPEAKKVLLEQSRGHQAEFTRKSQELSDKVKYADAVRSIFSDQERAQFRNAGTHELQVAAYLMQLQRFSQRDPQGYIKWAAQNLGVDLATLAPQATQQAAAPTTPADPLADLLSDPKVRQLEARLAEQERWRQANERAWQDQQRQQWVSGANRIQGAIQNFRTQLNDAGQLKFPHFDAVQQQMGALMDTNPELRKMPDGPEKLELAYNLAVRAHPEAWKAMFEAEVSKRMQAQAKQAEAQRAQRVAAVKPAKGVATAPVRPRGLDDAVAQAMGKLGF